MFPTFGEQRPDSVYRPAVYAVICNNAGHVALVREAGCLFLPGGGLEAGEDLETALMREVREECCKAIVIERLGEALQYFTVRERSYGSHGVYFAARFTGELEGIPEHELVWYEPSEALTSVFHQAHRWAIALALLSAWRAATPLPQN
jgi:8-oxo-dGTP diphosphatase